MPHLNFPERGIDVEAHKVIFEDSVILGMTTLSWLLMRSFHLLKKGLGGKPRRPPRGHLNPPHRRASFLGHIHRQGRETGRARFGCVSVLCFS